MTVSCTWCIERQEEIALARQRGIRARDLYDVGNISITGMGHQYYNTGEGRAALCIVKRRKDDEAAGA